MIALYRVRSADSSGPVSPAGPGQVTVPGDSTEGANGTSGDADLTVIEDGDPLLHHSYSGGLTEEPVTAQEGPTEEVRDEQVSGDRVRLEASHQPFVPRKPVI